MQNVFKGEEGTFVGLDGPDLVVVLLVHHNQLHVDAAFGWLDPARGAAGRQDVVVEGALQLHGESLQGLQFDTEAQVDAVDVEGLHDRWPFHARLYLDAAEVILHGAGEVFVLAVFGQVDAEEIRVILVLLQLGREMLITLLVQRNLHAFR